MRLTEQEYSALVAKKAAPHQLNRMPQQQQDQPTLDFSPEDPFAPEALAQLGRPSKARGGKVKKAVGSGRRENDSPIEAELALMLRTNRVEPAPRRQADDWHIGGRKWRLDFYWPEHGLAAEVDGGLYVNGRHNRGAAMEEQYYRDQEAAKQGILVLRFSPKQVKSGRAVEVIRHMLLRSMA